MNMRKSAIIWLSLSCVFLAGCFGTTTNTDVTAVKASIFELDIPSSFQVAGGSDTTISGSSNRLLAKYVVGAMAAFRPSFVIATSDINGQLTTKEFADITIKKLSSELAGYKFSRRGSSSFQCWNKKIDYYIHVFNVASSLSEDKPSIRYAQALFVSQGYGYIMSFTAADETTINSYVDSFTTLRCP